MPLPLDDCTFATCDILDSWYGYRPSLPANAAFAAIFAISLSAFLTQGILSKRFIGFSVAMVFGTFGETLGYLGRIMLYNNPWKKLPFTVQYVCLVFSPAFLAAGIYITLSRVVAVFGQKKSRLPAIWYPRIFIPCDIFALSLQSLGGGIAGSGNPGESKANIGKNIVIAGLVAQVVTMLIFILLATDFGVRTWLHIRTSGNIASKPYGHRGNSFFFYGFLVALSVSTLCIFARCVYRVAELSDGWGGRLFRNETLFIVLEGVMVAIAVVLLNLFHPGLCFKEGYEKEISMEMKGTKPKDGRRWRITGSKNGDESVVDSMSA